MSQSRKLEILPNVIMNINRLRLKFQSRELRSRVDIDKLVVIFITH